MAPLPLGEVARSAGEGQASRPLTPAFAQRQRGSALALGVLAVACVLLPGPACGAPSPDEIIRRALDIHRDINDLTAQVKAEIKAPEGAELGGQPRVQTVQFKVLVKRPDKVKIEADQPVMMPKQLFLAFFNLGSLIADNAKLTLIGEKTQDGVPIYAIKATAPEEQRRDNETILFWIDGQRWILQRMLIPIRGPGGGFDLNVRWSYTQVGNYLLPQRIAVNLPKSLFGDKAQGDGEASLTMTDWQVNVGLQDSVFQ